MQICPQKTDKTENKNRRERKIIKIRFLIFLSSRKINLLFLQEYINNIQPFCKRLFPIQEKCESISILLDLEFLSPSMNTVKLRICFPRRCSFTPPHLRYFLRRKERREKGIRMDRLSTSNSLSRRCHFARGNGETREAR